MAASFQGLADSGNSVTLSLSLSLCRVKTSIFGIPLSSLFFPLSLSPSQQERDTRKSIDNADIYMRACAMLRARAASRTNDNRGGGVVSSQWAASNPPALAAPWPRARAPPGRANTAQDESSVARVLLPRKGRVYIYYIRFLLYYNNTRLIDI